MKLKSKAEISEFVGREQQLVRLARFLENGDGGAVLIAGDRGSGKTSLVNEAIGRADHKRGFTDRVLRRHTRSKQIVVQIPLIIAPPEKSTEGSAATASYYRSMLMRSITRGLESDLLTRRYKWLDLPKRWYRSIGYIQALHRLLPYAKYTSLTKNWGQKLSITKSPFSAGVDVATAAELEISDTVLEMNLRHLFNTHSNDHEFILIIDELDKLDKAGGKVNVEDIALLLKNLFNETGVHAFFISDEPTLGRITKAVKLNPFCEEHTLFKDMLLLNQMLPDEFDQMIRPFVRGLDAKKKLKYTASLSLLTRMMPYEVRKFELQHGRDTGKLEEIQRIQLGSYDYLYRTTMQVYINHVYREFYGRHGYYYDRVLYKALTEAGNNILDTRARYVHSNDYTTILYPTSLFPDDTSERNFKNSQPLDKTNLAETPSIIMLVEELNSDEQSSMSFAIGKLIALLDRGGWLDLKRADTSLFELAAFFGDTFNIDNLEDISSSLDPTEKERTLVARVNKIGNIYISTVGTALWTDLWPTCIEIPNIHNGTGVSISKEWQHNFKQYWSQLNEKVDTAPKEIINSISTKLSTHLTPIAPPAKRTVINDHELDVVYARKKVKIILNYDGKAQPSTAGYDKIFVINDEGSLFPRNRSRYIKQFNLNKDWKSIDEVIKQVAVSINNL